MEECLPIVIDSGSEAVRIGYSGLDSPSITVHRIGSTKSMRYAQVTNDSGKTEIKPFKYGAIGYPIERGVIDWRRMVSLLHFSYEILELDPKSAPVLMSDTIKNPINSRETMAETMFEKFDIPGLFVIQQSVLSLFCAGKTTGVSVGCGEGVTYSVPIEYGIPVTTLDSIYRSNTGGDDITNHMMNVLRIGGFLFKSSEYDLVKDIKEKMGIVSMNYAKDVTSTHHEKDYELPDGNVITLGTERIECTEPIFNPSVGGRNSTIGIVEATFDSIENCDKEIQEELYQNIVLSGGSTMFPGFIERFSHELTSLAKVSQQIAVLPAQRNSVWRGASYCASVPAFKPFWISKAEYSEIGTSVVRKYGKWNSRN